jgi:hypothetical protein
VVWKPPIDPVSGEARWDEAYGPADPLEPPDGPFKRGRRKRSKAAVGAVGAAGTAGAVGAFGAEGATALDPGPGFNQPRPDPEVGARPPGGPFDGAPLVATRTDESGGSPPPGTYGTETGPPEPGGKQPARNNQRVLLLSLVLILLIGAIVYVGFVKKDSNPTTTTLTPASNSSPLAADTALATAINLRLTDLPAGWSTSTTTGQVPRPPIPPATAEVKANRLLASCVGASYASVAGLFGGSVLSGQTDSVSSPRFQSGSDPNIQMYSVTTVLSTPAEAQALAAPFANPNFVNCFGEYQTALASAAVPGATATVQAVTLTAPTGVKSFGYLTQLVIPNQANQVIGEAFLIGGRIETRLEPTTDGPPVPSDAFNPAYNAVAGRIATSVNK